MVLGLILFKIFVAETLGPLLVYRGHLDRSHKSSYSCFCNSTFSTSRLQLLLKVARNCECDDFERVRMLSKFLLARPPYAALRAVAVSREQVAMGAAAALLVWRAFLCYSTVAAVSRISYTAELRARWIYVEQE